MVCVWIEKFQVLIVGFFGFLGVCITLAYNAHLARTMQRNELDHERQTLRGALLEELKIIQKALLDEANSIDTNRAWDMDQGKSKSYCVPIAPMDDVYRSSINRIGLLPQSETRQVIRAYLTLRAMPSALLLLFGPQKKIDSYASIPVSEGPRLSELLRSVIDILDDAITVLKPSQ